MLINVSENVKQDIRDIRGLCDICQKNQARLKFSTGPNQSILITFT